MGVYAVEIRGTVIAVFDAASVHEADHYLRDEGGLAEDWTVLESEGKAIWYGVEELTLREATPFEYNRWQASRNEAIDSGGSRP
jgi:hypothetical protein